MCLSRSWKTSCRCFLKQVLTTAYPTPGPLTEHSSVCHQLTALITLPAHHPRVAKFGVRQPCCRASRAHDPARGTSLTRLETRMLGVPVTITESVDDGRCFFETGSIPRWVHTPPFTRLLTAVRFHLWECALEARTPRPLHPLTTPHQARLTPDTRERFSTWFQDAGFPTSPLCASPLQSLPVRYRTSARRILHEYGCYRSLSYRADGRFSRRFRWRCFL